MMHNRNRHYYVNQITKLKYPSFATRKQSLFVEMDYFFLQKALAETHLICF